MSEETTITPTLLDWRASSHSSNEPKPCCYCSKPTYLRDAERSPSHKVCAEQAAATKGTT